MPGFAAGRSGDRRIYGSEDVAAAQAGAAPRSGVASRVSWRDGRPESRT